MLLIDILIPNWISKAFHNISQSSPDPGNPRLEDDRPRHNGVLHTWYYKFNLIGFSINLTLACIKVFPPRISDPVGLCPKKGSLSLKKKYNPEFAGNRIEFFFSATIGGLLEGSPQCGRHACHPPLLHRLHVGGASGIQFTELHLNILTIQYLHKNADI